MALKRSESNDEGGLTAVGALNSSLNVGGESGAEAVHARLNEAAHVPEPAEDVELSLASVFEVGPGESWYEVFIEEEEEGVEDAGGASFYSWGRGCEAIVLEGIAPLCQMLELVYGGLGRSTPAILLSREIVSAVPQLSKSPLS